MKKTLAAVLAAAMALSTASVVFARDTLIDEDLGTGSTADVEEKILYGKNIDRLINELGDFDGAELAEQVDAGNITVTAIVTEGSNKLDGKPTITLFRRNISGSSSQVTANRDVYTWNGDVVDEDGKVIIKSGSRLTTIPVYDNNGVWDFANGQANGKIEQMKSSFGTRYTELRDALTTDGWLTKSSNTLEDNNTPATRGDKVLRLRFKVADTYGTGSTTVGMKLRITVRKNFESTDGISYKKGDTYTTEEFKYKAEYNELDQYNEDMQLMLQEVDDRNVKFDASDLYDQIGADTFSISFEDTARFEARLSASQKDVNLFYDLDEKTDVTDAYPNVDFEFITFRGNPSFVNSGTMTFNAIGGRNTQVYTYDGEALTPLDGSYDSTYDTVTVKGVKKLGTFVVASEILEEEEPDEPAEPVSSAPVVEGPEEDENPKTGAC